MDSKIDALLFLLNVGGQAGRQGEQYTKRATNQELKTSDKCASVLEDDCGTSRLNSSILKQKKSSGGLIEKSRRRRITLSDARKRKMQLGALPRVAGAPTKTIHT